MEQIKTELEFLSSSFQFQVWPCLTLHTRITAK